MENNTTQVQNAPNKQLLINQEEFTGFIISKIKDHSPAGTAPLEAFKTFVNNLFYFSTGRINYTEELTQQEYYNAFCGFILSELTYSEFVSDEYFNLIFAYYGFNIKTNPLDNDYLAKLQSSIKEEQKQEQELKMHSKGVFTMNDNFLKNHYPQITQLYYDYINSNAYAKHPITSNAEYNTSKAIDQALKELKQGREIQACDILTSGLATYEHGGFILGFSLAMSLIQEGSANKTA